MNKLSKTGQVKGRTLPSILPCIACGGMMNVPGWLQWVATIVGPRANVYVICHKCKETNPTHRETAIQKKLEKGG